MKTGNRHEAIGNTKRAKVLGFALCAVVFALCFSAEAQQPKKVARIGYLSYGSVEIEKSSLAVLQQGLRELGYVEGKNIVVEGRYAEGRSERFPELLAELIGLKVDVLVVAGETLRPMLPRRLPALSPSS